VTAGRVHVRARYDDQDMTTWFPPAHNDVGGVTRVLWHDGQIMAKPRRRAMSNRFACNSNCPLLARLVLFISHCPATKHTNANNNVNNVNNVNNLNKLNNSCSDSGTQRHNHMAQVLAMPLCEMAMVAADEHDVIQHKVERIKTSELVKINAGGTVFCTTKSTLCAEASSVLAALFAESGSVTRSSSGDCVSVFLDCNGRAFEAVLDWLRR
jgi:hypothetical protein